MNTFELRDTYQENESMRPGLMVHSCNKCGGKIFQMMVLGVDLCREFCDKCVKEVTYD